MRDKNIAERIQTRCFPRYRKTENTKRKNTAIPMYAGASTNG
jgi:hypothetical protein